MLGKLIKYEWKSLWGVETLIASIILVFSIAEAVTLQTPLYANLFLDQKDLSEQMEVFSTMTLFFGFFLTAMLCSGVVFASLIYLGIRFYRSMYCDEGYLTHTLPVSKKQLLTAKILTAVLWQIIITLAVAVSVGVLVASAVFLAIRNGTDVEEIVDDVRDVYVEIGNVSAVVHVLFSGALYFLLSPVCNIITLFGSISVGQLFKKHRGLMGVVVFFGVGFLTNIFTTITRGIGNVFLLASSDDMYKSINSWMLFSVDINFLVSFIVAVVLTIITYVILKKKLNLQ